MNRADAHDLMRRLEANFQAFAPASEMALDAFADALADIPTEYAVQAATSLLYENRGERLPNGPAVRHRVMEDAGLLAPAWPEALALAADVHHGRRSPADVPGPVRVIDPDALHATFTKSWEAAYEVEARAHDRRVLMPGGVEELIAAASWLAAVRERTERLRLAQQCAADLLDPPALLPGPSTPDEALAEYIDRWKAEHGEVPQLGPVLADADERWTSAPNVVAHVAELRRLAHTRRNGSA